MKESKKLIIIVFILLALPIPLSLVSWIGTLISVADMGMVKWSQPSECIQAIVALLTMLTAGTYIVTYVISLTITIKNKKISLISLLPLFHIILFAIFLFVWMWLNKIYKA